MGAYFKTFKRVRSTVLSTLILSIPIIISLSLKRSYIIFVAAYCFVVVIIFMIIKSTFYARNTKLRESTGDISYLPLLFLLPIKRKSIIIFEFIWDIIIILVSIAFLDTILFAFYTFKLIDYFNPLLSFVLPFSFITATISCHTIIYSISWLLKNSALRSITEIAGFLLPFFAGYLPILYLTDSTQRVENFILNIYTNPVNLIIILFVSIVLFLISFIVNITAIYRREV
ncbi:hypothetical protein [Anaerocellum danielii]|uniref:ABC-2 family transporter protein n=1 Tax=Anaerocellum danielii TaxID=1387557 RepID=A0ABZ0U1I3_9FIRM|nr:hypothetical protein [Caldicellulosiruptor danielii]WPX08942.1 hypothetical protein SOJ16_000105 [Caldicellulosiruptor danielii]